jgi:Ni/Fe-hydrogenase subunit HybB-like protein
MTVVRFLRDAVDAATSGGVRYHLWMGFLTFVMLVGVYAYGIQFREGLAVTGMSDHVSWGLYISNFTFLVGLAAAAVMLVLPAYVLEDVDFRSAVLIGEGVAVAALIMCLSFVVADLGGPLRAWHMIPGIGFFNFPRSMLAWDVLVLNGYLALNLAIPAYILFAHWRGREPKKKLYLPFVYLSVFWAIGIHLVTAFLYAGLPARPFWNTSLLGPRFLASAFAAGPAFMILILYFIRRNTAYRVGDDAFRKLALIATVAAQINLVMLGSELFKEFYFPTEHGASARYLFFGLHGHDGLVPWIWTSVGLNLLATGILTLNPLRRDRRWLVAACGILFVAIWMEKGIGLIIPGFIPSPLGEMVEYLPSGVELAVTAGIWALGLFVLTVLIKVALPIELGRADARTPRVDARVSTGASGNGDGRPARTTAPAGVH